MNILLCGDPGTSKSQLLQVRFCTSQSFKEIYYWREIKSFLRFLNCVVVYFFSFKFHTFSTTCMDV